MASTWSGTPSIWGNSDSVRMALLTISLAGVQLVWGIEMAYCSPYLLSLGLSKSNMSLVWIVGPLSGLVTQPVVGVMSDRTRLKWGRRRPFMFVGSLLVGVGLIVLGWTAEIVGIFMSPGSDAAKVVTIIFAVLALYILDFSINAVQASCRALVVDSLSVDKQQLGSAWASRMIAIGNVAGYFAGTVDLKAIFGTTFGNTQFKQLCIFSSLALLTCIGITSLSVTERVLLVRKDEDNQGILNVLKTIFNTMLNLPKRIGDICRIWFFAWIGWFPFMIYNTTFVGEVLQRYDIPMRESIKSSEDLLGDIARVGSMALVGFSCVSLAGSITLPWLIASPESPDSDGSRKGQTKGGWMEECGNTLELIRPDLVTAWMLSHVMFAIAMFSTLFIGSVSFATFVVGICGIPWALMTWAPFSIVGEEINRMGDPNGAAEYSRVSRDADEEQVPMMDMSRSSLGSIERPSVPSILSEGLHEGGNELSGVYLGIINVFACLPQFVSTFISFIVFSILEPGKSPEFSEGGAVEKPEPDIVNAIAVVLGIGALSVLCAAHYTLKFKS